MNRRFVSRAALLVAALAMSVSATLGQEYGGVLRMGMDSDIAGVNFAKNGGNDVVQYGSLIAESLVDYDEQCNLVPSLAERWEISDDAKSVTFHLRQGVMFHNGIEFTADAVKANVDYRMDEKNGAQTRNVFVQSGLTSMDVIDKYTIRFNTDDATVAFFDLMERRKAQIFEPGALESNPDHPVGTGPFKFVEWSPGQFTRMVRNENYWKADANGNKLPYVDEVIARPFKDDTTRFLALRAGDIDWNYEISFDQIPDLQKNPPEGIKAQIRPGARWVLMEMQQGADHNGPLTDKRVREAIAYVLDKKEVIEGLTWGIGEVANQIYPKGQVWNFSEVEDPYQDANIDKARELLAEAGHANGLKLVMVVRNQTFHQNFATIVQAQLAQAGIDVELRILDIAAHREAIRGPGWDLNVGEYSFLPDPHWRYRTAFSSGSSTNYGRYSNPEVDELLTAAGGETDPAKRREMYLDVLKTVNEDVGIVFFGHMPLAKASQARLNNYVTNCQGDTIWSDGGASHAWFEGGKNVEQAGN